jgi:hypothetical protein
MNCINFFSNSNLFFGHQSQMQRHSWIEIALLISGIVLFSGGVGMGTLGLFVPSPIFPSFVNHALGTIGYKGSIAFISSFGAVGMIAIAISACRFKKMKEWNSFQKFLMSTQKQDPIQKTQKITQETTISEEPKTHSNATIPFKYMKAKSYIRWNNPSCSQYKIYVKIDEEKCYVLDGGEVQNGDYLRENECEKSEITFLAAEIFSNIEEMGLLVIPNSYCYYPFTAGRLTRYACIIRDENDILKTMAEALKSEEIEEHRDQTLSGFTEFKVN